MKIHICIRLAVLTRAALALAEVSGHAQGTFQNLDFEFANLPVVPSGQPGGFVSANDGIPGWQVYYGASQVTQVWHNDLSLGAVNVSVLGPDWTEFAIPQGKFCVVLQSGLDISTAPQAAGISQFGAIPSTARSVQFAAQNLMRGGPYGGYGQLQLEVSGQSLSLVPLATTANYVVFGADVTGYAGSTVELSIAALPMDGRPHNSFVIDAISFSDLPIPEPGAFGLLTLGGLLLGWRLRHRER